ncbi:hypothetical protein HDV03_002665 [Kappamyces sp. JEL0829]|nr:hypothetical protein HDV03_002665 [Kappamyces sp. JEL0829]
MTEKSIQTLSQSEILALKRKKKKNNSESSQSRLDKILGAYSRDIDHTAPIDMVDNVPCLSVDEPEGSGISDGAKDHAGDGEGRVKETLAREPAIPKDPLAQTEGFPGFNAMEDVVVPEDIFVERTPAPDPSQPTAALGDALSWVHALVLSVFIAIAFGRWFTSHAHEMFGVDKLQTHLSPDISNVWWKKMCRQLDWMSHHPAHYDLGASSAVTIPWTGWHLPVWQFFTTIETVLLSLRLMTLQMAAEKKPFAIPEIMKPAMTKVGLNPAFYESLISSLYGYYDMYDTVMRDLYWAIFLMGIGVTVATTAHHLLNICM